MTLSNHSSKFIRSFDFALSVKYRVDVGRTMLPSNFIRPTPKSRYTTGDCVCISRISPIFPSLIALSCPGNSMAYRAFFADDFLYTSFPSLFINASDASISTSAVAGRAVDIILTFTPRSCAALARAVSIIASASASFSFPMAADDIQKSNRFAFVVVVVVVPRRARLVLASTNERSRVFFSSDGSNARASDARPRRHVDGILTRHRHATRRRLHRRARRRAPPRARWHRIRLARRASRRSRARLASLRRRPIHRRRRRIILARRRARGVRGVRERVRSRANRRRKRASSRCRRRRRARSTETRWTRRGRWARGRGTRARASRVRRLRRGSTEEKTEKDDLARSERSRVVRRRGRGGIGRI